jgi:hypothetical protein
VNQVRQVIVRYNPAQVIDGVDDRHRYEIILYWSNEVQSYMVEVPELAGYATDGTSP